MIKIKIDVVHQQVLKKFSVLSGEIIKGAELIRGKPGSSGVPPDQYVNEAHIMSDLVRGFYKPAKKSYLLSCRVTESVNNYGKQINWSDKSTFQFSSIEMLPPSNPKDGRVKGDINAARYNMRRRIPIGLLYNPEKGINVILGLGLIKEERSNGVFIVKPYTDFIQ